MVMVGGLTVVNPNEARVLILFGNYSGRITRDGFWWVNPFAVKKKVSAAGPQLRDQQAQGKRQPFEPDRDRRGGGLAGG
jgi:regulator of protease activity HflC (stomatin/prohibitin superfamily)